MKLKNLGVHTDNVEQLFNTLNVYIEESGTFYIGTITLEEQSRCLMSSQAFASGLYTFNEFFSLLLSDLYKNMNRTKAQRLLKKIKKHKDGSQTLTVYNGDRTSTKLTLRKFVAENQETKESNELAVASDKAA